MTEVEHRLTLADIEARDPRLIPALRGHTTAPWCRDRTSTSLGSTETARWPRSRRPRRCTVPPIVWKPDAMAEDWRATIDLAHEGHRGL